MKIRDAGDLGRLVKLHRAANGMSQESLADKACVSRSTIVDLEHGRNTSIGTALKVLALLDSDLSASGPKPEPDLYWTADKTARAIRRELDKGDPDFAMRTLFMAVDFFDDLDAPRRRLFLRAPSSTGRKRWDALLACTVAYKCRQHNIKPPAWTHIEPLRHKWFATPRRNVSPAWKQRMADHTPAEFTDANIVFDARELVSV